MIQVNSGQVIWEAELDTARIDAQIDALNKKMASIKLNIPDSVFSSVANNIKKTNGFTITPKVNHRPLTELNKHLDLKLKHYQSLQSYFARNPLKISTKHQNANSSGSSSGSTVIKANFKNIEIGLNKIIAVLTQNKDSSKDINSSVKGQYKFLSDNTKSLKSIVGNTKNTFFANIIRGFQQGIGMTYAKQGANSFLKGIKYEERLGLIFEKVGEQVYKFGQKVGNIAFQGMTGRESSTFFAGLNEGLKDIKTFINKDVIDKFNNNIDKELVNLIEYVVNINTIAKTASDPLNEIPVFANKIKNVFKSIATSLSGIKTEILESAVKRKKSVIAEQANAVRQLPIPQYSYSEDKEKTVIVSGGFAGKQGDAAKDIVALVDFLYKGKADVQKIKTPFTDVAQPNDENIIGWLGNAGARIIEQSISKGFNPDSLDMVLKVLASKQANPDRPVELVGYSAGGYVVNDAIAILKELGITDVKGTAIGTPTDIGITNELPTENYQSFLGDKDGLQILRKLVNFLGLLNKNTTATTVANVEGHNFEAYAGTEVVQERMTGEQIASSRGEFDILRLNPADTLSELGQTIQFAVDAFLKQNYELSATLLESIIPVIKDGIKEFQDVVLVSSNEETVAQAGLGLQELSSMLDVSNSILEAMGGTKNTNNTQINLLTTAIAKALGLKKINKELPSVVADENIDNNNAIYNFLDNIIKLNPQDLEEINTNGITNISDELFKTLIYEIKHFFQKVNGVTLKSSQFNQLPISVQQRLKIKAQGSVDEIEKRQGGLTSAQKKDLFNKELDAYFFEEMYAEQLKSFFQNLQSNFDSAQFPEINVSSPVLLEDSYFPPLGGNNKETVDRNKLAQKIEDAFTSEGVKQLIKVLNKLFSLNLKVSTTKQDNINTLLQSDKLNEINQLISGSLMTERGNEVFIPNESLSGKTKYRKQNSLIEKSLPELNNFELYLKRYFKDTFLAIQSQLKQLGKLDQKELQKLVEDVAHFVKALEEIELTYNLSASQSQVIQGYKSVGTASIQQINPIIEADNMAMMPDLSSLENVLQSVGENIGEGLAEGLKSKEKLVYELIENIASNLVEIVERKLEIQSPSKVFEQIGSFIIQGLEKGLEGIDGVLEIVSNELNELEEILLDVQNTFSNLLDGESANFNNLANNLKNITSNFIETTPLAQKFLNVFDNLKAFFVQGILLSGITALFSKITDGAFDAALQVENLERSLSFSTGQNGLAVLERVKQQAKEVGVNFVQAAEGLRQFSASTIGTSLNTQAEQIVGQFQTSFGAYGLNTEQQEGAFLALSQMASKGVVSMEELRAQLSERLPGALQASARAMGLTLPEFNKLVESGQLLSDEFLPALASQLEKDSFLALATSTKSTQAELTRLENNIFELQAEIGKIPLVATKTGLPILNEVLQFLKGNIDNIVIALTSFIGLLGVNYVATLVRVVKATGLFDLSLKALGKTAIFTMKLLAPYLLLAGSVLALSYAVENSIAVLNAGSKELKQFGEEATKVAQQINTLKNIETKPVNIQRMDRDFSIGGSGWFDPNDNSLRGQWDSFVDFVTGRSAKAANAFQNNMANAVAVNEALLSSYMSAFSSTIENGQQKLIDLGNGVKVTDDYSENTVNQVSQRLKELRGDQQRLRLEIADASAMGNVDLMQTLTEQKTAIEQEINRVSNEPFGDVAGLEKMVSLGEKALDDLKQQEMELMANKANFADEREYNTRLSQNQTAQAEMTKLVEKNRQALEKRNQAIKKETELYFKQLQVVLQVERAINNITFTSSLNSIDSQINATLQRVQGSISDFELEVKLKEIQQQEIEVNLKVKTTEFGNLQSELQRQLNKIDQGTLDVLGKLIGSDNLAQDILNKQISPETLNQLLSSEDEKIKEAIESAGAELDIPALLKNAQKYLSTWQEIKQSQLDSVNLLKEQVEANRQRIQDIKAFARQLEDLDISLRDYYLNRARGLQDLQTSFEDASLQFRRQQRDLIESYDDLQRGLISQSREVRNTIEESRRNIAKMSAMEKMRNNLKLGSQGLFSGIFDVIEQIFQSQDDSATEVASSNNERLQLEQETLDLNRQIRGLVEQSFDNERARLQQIKDLTRQQNDFVTGQIDSFRGITNTIKDMELEAKKFGLSFSGIWSNLDAINNNYAKLSGNISGLIGTLSSQLRQTEQKLKESQQQAQAKANEVQATNRPAPSAPTSKPTTPKPQPVTRPQPQSQARNNPLRTADAETAFNLLRKIPSNPINGTAQQRAIANDNKRLFLQGLRSGEIKIQVNDKNEIKSITASARYANLMADGRFDSNRFNKETTFVYGSKIGAELTTFFKNMKRWNGLTEYEINNRGRLIKKPVIDNQRITTPLPTPRSQQRVTPRFNLPSIQQMRDWVKDIMSFAEPEQMVATAGMGDLSTGLFSSPYSLDNKVLLAQYNAITDIADVNSIIDETSQNRKVTEDAILNNLELQASPSQEQKLNQIFITAEKLRQQKLESYNLRQQEIRLRLTATERQNAIALTNLIRQNNDTLRSQLETYRQINQEVNNIVLNAKGFLTNNEAVGLATEEVKNKYHGMREQIYQAQRELETLLDLQGDVSQAELMSDPRFSKLSPNIKRLVEEAINEGLSIYEALEAKLPEFAKKLSELNNSEAIELEFRVKQVILEEDLKLNEERSNALQSVQQFVSDNLSFNLGIDYRDQIAELERVRKVNQDAFNLEQAIAKAQKEINDAKEKGDNATAEARANDIKQYKELLELLPRLLQLENERTARNSDVEKQVRGLNNLTTAYGMLLETQTQLNPLARFGTEQTLKQLEVLEKYTTQINDLRERIANTDDVGVKSDLQDVVDILTRSLPEAMAMAKNEFSMLGQAIKQPLENAFSSVLTDVVKGTKSLGDVFGAFLEQVASFFTQLASQMLTSGLMSFFGKLGLFGKTKTVGTFKDGGEVPNFAMGGTVAPEMMSLGMAISEAMRREGAGAVPIVASIGEEVLSNRTGDAQFFRTLQQTGEWDKLKLNYRLQNQVPNFAFGGTVGGSQAMSSGSSRTATGATVVNNWAMTVVTPDANSFRKSQSMISQEQRLRQERAKRFS